MEFMIGGLAGAGATFFTNPMDVIKTRLQLQGELRAKSQYSTCYRGIFHALYVIGKTEGPVALQRGLTPALLLGFTMNSVRLGFYRMGELNHWNRNEYGEVSVSKTMLCASVGGILSGATSNPISVIKTRIQASSHPSIAVGRQHNYKSTYDAFRTIYHIEGLRGFFSGVNATCTRLAIGSAAQLTTFSIFKNQIMSSGIDNVIVVSFLASIGCGAAVVLVEAPFDVINTRLMNQGPASPDGKFLYNGITDCMRKICRTEGFTGLYKGVGPLYVRIAPHTTISLVIWDLLNDYMIS